MQALTLHRRVQVPLVTTHNTSKKVTQDNYLRILEIKVNYLSNFIQHRFKGLFVHLEYYSDVTSNSSTCNYETLITGLVDNTPEGERRRGGREYCKLHQKQNKNPRTETWKKFLLKSDFSSFFTQSFSCSEQSRLVRLQKSGLGRVPRVGRSSEGRRATLRSPPRSGTRGPTGPAAPLDPRVLQLRQPAAPQVLCYRFS